MLSNHEPKPAYLGHDGYPVMCVNGEYHRHFFRRQENRARWFCSTCDLASWGADDPLPENIETMTVPAGYADMENNLSVGTRVDPQIDSRFT